MRVLLWNVACVNTIFRARAKAKMPVGDDTLGVNTPQSDACYNEKGPYK